MTTEGETSDQTAERTIAMQSAERAAAIIGAPHFLLYLVVVDDGKLKDAMITRDFPRGDFRAALEHLRDCLIAEERRIHGQEASQHAGRVEEIEAVPEIDPKG